MIRALSTCKSFDAHLVLVTRKVSGGADFDPRDHYRDHKRRRWGRCYYDDEDEDEEESEDEDQTTTGHHGMTEVNCNPCTRDSQI